MPGVQAPGRAKIAARTLRTDRWWLQGLVTVTLLVAWLLYALIRTASQRAYFVPEYHYLSPFSSPCVTASCNPDAMDFGQWFGHFPPFVPFGLLVLPFLLGFRLTCYYYRKAYYRAFFGDPAACAVGELRSGGYRGETAFPFILQNLHRYFLYLALGFLVVLWMDVFRAFTFAAADGTKHFGIGGGSLAILASTTLLSLYTLSCHSLRHLLGGRIDCFSCAVAGGPRRKTWSVISVLNEHHMAWAWWSLFAVCFADFFVRMCSMGVFNDPRIW